MILKRDGNKEYIFLTSICNWWGGSFATVVLLAFISLLFQGKKNINQIAAITNHSSPRSITIQQDPSEQTNLCSKWRPFASPSFGSAADATIPSQQSPHARPGEHSPSAGLIGGTTTDANSTPWTPTQRSLPAAAPDSAGAVCCRCVICGCFITAKRPSAMKQEQLLTSSGLLQAELGTAFSGNPGKSLRNKRRLEETGWSSGGNF